MRPEPLSPALSHASAIRSLAFCFAASLISFGTASSALADIEIQFTATVTSAFGDVGGVLSGGEAITGTLLLDDSAAGAYTPSPNPQFVRSEMLYSGAVISTSLVIDGDPVSGTGGDVELLDADPGTFAGEDNYQADATLDTGSVGGVPLSIIHWIPAYPATGFAIASGDPLFAPPPLDPGTFNQVWFETPGGGSAFGSLDGFTVVGAPPSVPVVGLLGSFTLAAAFCVSAVSVMGRRKARS